MNDSVVAAGAAIVAILAVTMIWLMYTYHNFLAKEAKIDALWDEVDKHLTLRRKLVPELIEAAGGRLIHIGEDVMRRIEDVNMQITDGMDDLTAAPLENELSGLLRRLRDDALKHRDLDVMHDQKFITTLCELVSMEGRAEQACERHNDLVREYNSSIRRFPANLIVSFLHFTPCEMRIFGSTEENA